MTIAAPAATTIPLVLTATIVPNDALGSHVDWQMRRREYLAALEFYRAASTVYFLENSSYDLLADRDFCELEGVALRKFEPSPDTQYGKGYLEFELPGSLVSGRGRPPRALDQGHRGIGTPTFETCWTNSVATARHA